MTFELVIKSHVNGSETLVNVSKDGLFKKNAELYEIDLFLLCGLGKGFKNKEHLIDTLIKMGNDISLDDEVYVKYNNKGERKFKPLFGYSPEINYLAYLSDKRKQEVEDLRVLKDKELIKSKKDNIKKKFNENFMIKEINAGFFEAIKDFKYINILRENNFLKGYISDMETYIRINETYREDQKESKEIATDKLKIMLQNYKNLRMVILSLKEYNKTYDKNLGIDPRYAENELEKIRLINETQTFDLYEQAKISDPDMFKSSELENAFDIYSMDELKDILTPETYEEHLNEYNDRKTYQNIIK